MIKGAAIGSRPLADTLDFRGRNPGLFLQAANACGGAMRFRFGDHCLDIGRRELRRAGRPIKVEPQVFDLLEFLLRNRERVIGKEELVGAIWGGRAVSDSAIDSRIKSARHAIGDSGATQSLIRTLPRKGFRFIGAAEEEAAGQADALPSDSVPAQDVRFCQSPDGIRLAVATCGTGFPLVRSGTWLTHIQQDWRSPVWSPLFRRLAAQFQLVRYDPRGCGLSDWLVPDISFDGFVRDLEAVVDWLRIERFALLGTSQSAAVSIAYAARHPDRVSHLILSGGFALGWRKRGSNTEIATREALLTLIEQGWGHDNPPFRQVFTTRLWPDVTADQARSFDELQRLSASPENAARVQRAVGEIDVTALLPSVKAPTLVLHSRGDATVPRELGLMLAHGIPNARFVEIDSRNHFPLPHEPAWEGYVEAIVNLVHNGDNSLVRS